MTELVSYTHSVKPAGEYMPGVPRFVYSARPTGKRWYTPSAPKEPTTRRTHGDIQVEWEVLGSQVLVGGKLAPVRVGRREFVGAIQRHGLIHALVYCTGCQHERRLTLETWIHGTGEVCQSCTRRRGKHRYGSQAA